MITVMRSNWTRISAALVVLLILAQPVLASKAAGVIAAVSAINAGKWGIIAAVDPEPASKTVCGVVTGVYGIISGGAWLYDVIADPPPLGPPIISAIYEGPAIWRDPATGELLPPNGAAPVAGASAWRVLSVVGNNFSWEPSKMSAAFGADPAIVLPLSTNTLMMVIVPYPNYPAGSFPRATKLTVTVEGVASSGYPFTIQAPSAPIGNPSTATNNHRATEDLSLSLIKNADWPALLTQEAPGLAPDERAIALGGADDMVSGATQIQGLLGTTIARRVVQAADGNPDAEATCSQALNYEEVVQAYATFLEVNPELQTLQDSTIEEIELRTGDLQRTADSSGR